MLIYPLRHLFLGRLRLVRLCLTICNSVSDCDNHNGGHSGTPTPCCEAGGAKKSKPSSIALWCGLFKPWIEPAC